MTPSTLAERLNDAARAGAPVSIVYREEGRPEARYSVLPISASARVLRARDLASDRVRVFLLAQLEIVTAAATAAPVVPAVRDASPANLDDVFAATIDELRSLGWHVSLAGDRLSLHPSDPSGRPMRTAVAVIANNTVSRTGGPRRRGRRPWRVVAPGLPKARAFASLELAVGLFMTQARAHAPALRGRRRPR